MTVMDVVVVLVLEKKVVVNIKITEEDRNIIEKLNFERDNLILILKYIEKFKINLSNNRIIEYKNKLKEINKQFKIAKKEIIQNKYLKDINYKYWKLDYFTCELIWEEK